MASVTFSLATEADEADLRRLLRQSPMPGTIAVTFEREPHYFRGAAIEGFHQAIACRDQETGALIGMGSRSVRPVYLNGTVQPVGYMSQLRTSQQHPWGMGRGRVVARAFQFFHTLHADARTPFYLMSVIADNRPAQRLLTSGLPGLPHLQPYIRWHTYIIYLGQARRPSPLPVGLRLERGDAAQVSAILDCLQRNGAPRQFAPFWRPRRFSIPTVRPTCSRRIFCSLWQAIGWWAVLPPGTRTALSRRSCAPTPGQSGAGARGSTAWPPWEAGPSCPRQIRPGATAMPAIWQ